MNRKELIDQIIVNKELNHLSKKDGEIFINTMLDAIKTAVKNGDEVSLLGFGTFSKVERAARPGVNPATKEKIMIEAKSVPKFRPGQAFKDLVC